MKRRTAVVIMFLALLVAGATWAIVLETGGHHEEAVTFVKEAGGGLGLFVILGFLLGAFD